MENMKPPWWDRVKEVDREEALVLDALGLPVWRDWSHNNGMAPCWFDAPFFRGHGCAVSGSEKPRAFYFYYTRNDAVE